MAGRLVCRLTRSFCMVNPVSGTLAGTASCYGEAAWRVDPPFACLEVVSS